MRNLMRVVITLLSTALLSAPAQAVLVNWTDWNEATSSTASGELLVGPDTITVDYSGTSNHLFVQTSAGSTWWNEFDPPPYTGGIVDNAPPNDFGIVALNAGGTVTVSFGQTVQDPFIGLVSWNGNIVNFDTPIELISEGRGFWGVGDFINVTPTGFTGSGELHGIIRLPGAFDSFSFTHTSEGWHGFTVGVEGLATPDCGVPGTPDCDTVPEPATLALFGLGLAVLGLRRRYRPSA